jgi:hypothetical protein
MAADIRFQAESERWFDTTGNDVFHGPIIVTVTAPNERSDTAPCFTVI